MEVEVSGLPLHVPGLHNHRRKGPQPLADTPDTHERCPTTIGADTYPYIETVRR